MNYPSLIWTGIGAALPVFVRISFVSLVRDVAVRSMATIWGVRLFDRCLGWLTKDEIWSGRWQLTWIVDSENFATANVVTSAVQRCFGTVVTEGIGITASGKKINYGFVGKLSRDRTILTGTWFDRRATTTG